MIRALKYIVSAICHRLFRKFRGHWCYLENLFEPVLHFAVIYHLFDTSSFILELFGPKCYLGIFVRIPPAFYRLTLFFLKVVHREST